MEKKVTYQDLLDSGSLKRELPVDFGRIERLISRARKDLETAQRIVEDDEAGALDFTYKAMFHAANALIRSQGYRPGAYRQHQGVVQAVERSLGKRCEDLLLRFNKLRIRRNEFEYQGTYRGSKAELLNDLKAATELIDAISKYIQIQNPQLKLKF